MLAFAFLGMALSWRLFADSPSGPVLYAGAFLFFALAFALTLHTLLFMAERIFHALRFVSGVAAIASVAFVFLHLAFADERSVASLVLSGFSFALFYLVMRFFPKETAAPTASWGSAGRAIIHP